MKSLEPDGIVRCSSFRSHRAWIRRQFLNLVLGVSLSAIVVCSGGGPARAFELSWRPWTDMQRGGLAVIYGQQARIYECFRSKQLPVSLEVRGLDGSWKAMQTVRTKRSNLCQGGSFGAIFNGRVTEVGRAMGGEIYLEMRIVSKATTKFRAYRSAPALIRQFKSFEEFKTDRIDTINRVLENLS